MAWQNVLQLIGLLLVAVLIAPAAFRLRWRSTGTLLSIACWLAIFVAVSFLIEMLMPLLR